mmetsp:Transcript_19474/g.28672  ORF Transcript_19474/g.28672 Transcript_19474/m.28672 type:complete len:247 (+) Transcript_19474:56-796(+)
MPLTYRHSPLAHVLITFQSLMLLLVHMPIMHAFSTTSTRPFALNIKFIVKPDRQDEFLKVMRNNIHQTMTSEPNALQFILGKDVDDDNTFYLHEEYKSRADHQDPHTKTKYYDDCIAFFDTEPFTEPHIADAYTLAHDGPAEKVKNVEAVCLNVELCIKPEVRDEFLDVIRNNKAGSDREPLCLQYSWGENVHTPNTFHFHEQYIGEEGLAAHNVAPHFAVWEEFASKGNPFAKPPIVQKFKALLD